MSVCEKDHFLTIHNCPETLHDKVSLTYKKIQEDKYQNINSDFIWTLWFNMSFTLLFIKIQLVRKKVIFIFKIKKIKHPMKFFEYKNNRISCLRATEFSPDITIIVLTLEVLNC